MTAFSTALERVDKRAVDVEPPVQELRPTEPAIEADHRLVNVVPGEGVVVGDLPQDAVAQQEQFLARLHGVSEPEEKRRRMDEVDEFAAQATMSSAVTRATTTSTAARVSTASSAGTVSAWTPTI